MPFNPKDFIQVAEILNEKGKSTDEAVLRSVIGRLYYAAYGYSCVKLNNYSMGISAHQDMVRTLTVSHAVHYKKAGKILERLFKNRKDADYKYNHPINRWTVDACFSDSEAFFKLMDQE